MDGTFHRTRLAVTLAAWASVAGQVATVGGQPAELISQWLKHGTAAGHAGDYYDNRDREHSDVKVADFEQLQRVTYSDEERTRKMDWGLPQKVRPHPTIGNASLAAPATQGGCLPRQTYMIPGYGAFLYELYRGNNLYVFPEHRDHDPGVNGAGGYGDLLPANSPYLVISQGSSGSDRAFVNAFLHTLAAFRPEVKAKLAGSGLLMPALQMIFRMCNKNLAGPEAYLTGSAHPTVFEGQNLDPVAMVKMAQGMTLKNLPPFAQIEVIEKGSLDGPATGQAGSEMLLDTPCAVAWVHRRLARDLHFVVSAELSASPGGEALVFHWVVLRGDAERIKIEPRAGGKVADITVSWQDRRPIAADSAMYSNRVDIGVIAHNGHYYSAPAILSVLTLANELRTHDERGRLVEIAYNASSMGLDPVAELFSPAHPVTSFEEVFETLAPGNEGLGAKLLREQLSEAELRALARAASRLAEANAKAAPERVKLLARQSEAREALRAAEEETKQREQALREAGNDARPAAAAAKEEAVAAERERRQEDRKIQDELVALAQPAKSLLAAQDPAVKASPEELVVRAFASLLDSPDLLVRCLSDPGELSGTMAADLGEAQRMAQASGVYEQEKDGHFRLRPHLEGDGKPVSRLTAWQRTQLREINAILLNRILFPSALRFKSTPYYLDPRLGVPRPVRDLYPP